MTSEFGARTLAPESEASVAPSVGPSVPLSPLSLDPTVESVEPSCAPLDVPEEPPLDVPDDPPLDVPDEPPELVVAVPSAVEPSSRPLLLLPPLLLQPATQNRPAEHAIEQPTTIRCLIDSPAERR